MTQRELQALYEDVRDEPIQFDAWLVFADALEAVGHRRLARLITRRVRAARRYLAGARGIRENGRWSKAHIRRWAELGDRVIETSTYLDRAVPLALGLRAPWRPFSRSG